MKRKLKRKFLRYIRDTWKNKLFAVFLLLTGILPLYLDNDGTLLVFTLIFSIPLFVTKESVFYKERVE